MRRPCGVLAEAVERGIDLLDTADMYGPTTTRR